MKKYIDMCCPGHIVIVRKLIRKTEKTYGWDFNAAGKVLNKKLTVVIFT